MEQWIDFAAFVGVGSRDQLRDLVKKRSGDIWLRLGCPEFGV